MAYDVIQGQITSLLVHITLRAWEGLGPQSHYKAPGDCQLKLP